MPENRNLYEQLLAKGYDKQSIDKVLHDLTMQYIQEQKQARERSVLKRLLHKLQISYPVIHLQHITSKGLLLLKTQFAKKPKNPV